MTAPPKDETETPTRDRCTHCEAADGNRYCTCCGRELDRRRDLSVKHFLKEAVLAVTDLDSVLIASFRSLLTKPGELTVEYLSGDRTRFMTPARLFLLCNVIYFIAVAQIGMSVLTVPLRMQLDQMVYRNVARSMVNQHLHMEAPAMTLEAGAARDSVKRVYAAKYDGATVGIGKVIVAALIPFYALLFQVLYVGRRRFFAEHLILATHLTAFLLAAIAVVGLAALVVEKFISVGSDDEWLFDLFFLTAFTGYAYLAQRTVYETGRTGAAVRTALLTASIIPILVALKFILFLVTLYWIG